MTTGAHNAGGFTKSAGASAIRGILVIAAAVVVGVLLMGRGLSDTNIEAAAAEKTETTLPESGAEGDGGEGETTIPPTTEPTSTTEAPPAEPELRDPSMVAALVLNAAEGKPGIAGRGTDVLKPLGYVTLKPENATVDGPTAILFAEGYAAEAAAVAEAFSLDPTTFVKPLDPANPPVEDTQAANVIVIIGVDGAIDI